MLESLDTLIAFALVMLVVSLLITVAVQMILAALNLRGRNLARGLSETFKVICPGLAAEAQGLVHHVLTGPLLSDSAYRFKFSHSQLASAARPDEVFDAIHRIAIGRHDRGDATPAQIAAFRANAAQLLQALGLPPDLLTHGSDTLSQAQETIRQLDADAVAAISTLPDAQQQQIRRTLSGYATQLQAYATHITTRAIDETATAGAAIDAAYQKFEYWYNVAQERAQTWFTTHARVVTIIFASLFTLLLQLDTVEIFRLVSTSKSVRDSLVAQTANVSKQAADIMSGSTTVLQDAVAKVAAGQPVKTATKLQTLQIPQTASRAEARKAVADSIGNDPAVLGAFDHAVDQTAEDRLQSSVENYRSLQTSLKDTGFELFPLKGWRWGPYWWTNLGPHLLGFLFSIALLSLGAPFWFNALKSLTNLRSAVANNIDDEQAKKGSVVSTTPPPTV